MRETDKVIAEYNGNVKMAIRHIVDTYTTHQLEVIAEEWTAEECVYAIDYTEKIENPGIRIIPVKIKKFLKFLSEKRFFKKLLVMIIYTAVCMLIIFVMSKINVEQKFIKWFIYVVGIGITLLARKVVSGED